MPAETFTYTMKNLDRALWRRVKAEAALEGFSVKDIIEMLLIDWLGRAKHLATPPIVDANNRQREINTANSAKMEALQTALTLSTRNPRG